jgi:Pyruvate/2-oxoacid:ferredoxin oxidoreductase delta subunit
MTDAVGLAKIVVPVLAAVVAWLANEWRKRVAEERQRREERYRQLLNSLSAFYEGTYDPEKKLAFISQVALCWLYCPDSVIRAAYKFLNSVRAGAGGTSDQAKQAFNELVLAMRKDLWSMWPLRRTRLAATDFQHFKVT